MRVEAYATVRDVPPPTAGREAGRRSDDDAAMLAGIEHLKDRLWHVAGHQMTATLFHTFTHLDGTRWRVAIEIDPLELFSLREWAVRANAILELPDGSLLDPEGRQLVGPDGRSDPAAQAPHPVNALARADRTRAQLAAAGIRVVESLPPIVGEGEVRHRPALEVAARACALGAVAVRAEGIATDDPLPVESIYERLPHLPQALSPREAAFMADDAPPQQAVVDMSWRYEACQELLWALGFVAELPEPTGPCSAGDTVQALFALADSDQAPRLRPIGELLDEVDLEYRRHWAAVQARIDAVPAPGHLDEGVLHERRVALNWLTCYGRAEWDDVETPT